MRYCYGILNTALPTIRPQGDQLWYRTRRKRDHALCNLREAAMGRGCSESRARLGIVPLTRLVASQAGLAWFDSLVEGRMPGWVTMPVSPT